MNDYEGNPDPEAVGFRYEGYSSSARYVLDQGPYQAEDHWVLEVADTGPGIQDVSGSTVARELDRPERGQSLPQPKTTLAYTGEGIGLTIIKRLCEILDAEISLSSRPAKGSTFRVELPEAPGRHHLVPTGGRRPNARRGG